MKNLLTATLPAMALLALGGCATSGALTSVSESDGVYYSSQDHTTANAALSQVQSNRTVAGSPNPDGYSYNAPASTTVTSTIPPGATDDANPDYYQGTATNAGITGATSDYYVSNYGSSYSPSGFGVPYTGPGVSTYNYAPAVAVTPAYYGSPWGYGAGLGFGYGYPYGGYSPYAYSPFYDPFYSPFYSPWYGYRSGLSLSFGYGFGSPWGYGYGYPYYGYGYGGYGYGYPYGGYGYGYYNRPVIYANGARTDVGGNPVLIGRRPGRGGSVMNGMMANGSTGNPVEIGRRNGGAFPTGGVVAPAGQPNADAFGGRAGRAATNFGGGQTVGQPAAGGVVNGGMPAGAAPQPARRGFFGGFFGNGSGNAGQPAMAGGADGQPMQRRSFSQPQFNNGGDRGFQPQQRSYSPPMQQRSFSQPTFSQPSAPSRSFGGGGGSFGGGGGSFGGGRGAGGRR